MAPRTPSPLVGSPWHAHGQLLEVRARDLQFTAEGAATLLNDTMASALEPEQVAAVHQRTRGWIVSFRLAALSLRGHSRNSLLHTPICFSSAGCRSRPIHQTAWARGSTERLCRPPAEPMMPLFRAVWPVAHPLPTMTIVVPMVVRLHRDAFIRLNTQTVQVSVEQLYHIGIVIQGFSFLNVTMGGFHEIERPQVCVGACYDLLLTCRISTALSSSGSNAHKTLVLSLLVHWIQ